MEKYSKDEKGMSKDLRVSLKELPRAKSGSFWAKKIITSLDYNPLNKINIHESIRI